jgi:hypothetical protein
MSMDHDQALASAFDDQAAKFERAPVQSDPAALERLVLAGRCCTKGFSGIVDVGILKRSARPPSLP